MFISTCVPPLLLNPEQQQSIEQWVPEHGVTSIRSSITQCQAPNMFCSSKDLFRTRRVGSVHLKEQQCELGAEFFARCFVCNTGMEDCLSTEVETGGHITGLTSVHTCV